MAKISRRSPPAGNGRVGEVANGGFEVLQFENPDLADRQVWRNLAVSKGSRSDGPFFEPIAEKRPLKVSAPKQSVANE